MMNWWNEREPREQALIAVAALLALLLTLFQFLFVPLMKAHERAGGELQRMMALHAGVEQGVMQLQARPSAAVPSAVNADTGESLELTLSRSAEASGLQISRLQPGSDGSLTLWFDDADPLVTFGWLAGLEDRNGLVVIRSSLARVEAGTSLRGSVTFGDPRS